MILDGNVYFGTQNANGNTTHITKHSIAANGVLGAAVSAAANGGAPYFGLITDGTNLYAATRRTGTQAGVFVGLTPAFATLSGWVNATLDPGLAGEPSFGIDGRLYGADLGTNFFSFSATTGTPLLLDDLGAAGQVGLTPLHGSDGHVYVPRRTGFLRAYAGNQLSWDFDPTGDILRYATMDCQGRVFVASAATVFALVSDDSGLADTPWPTLRRDSRNTGNAGALRYGMRTVEGCTQ